MTARKRLSVGGMVVLVGILMANMGPDVPGGGLLEWGGISAVFAGTLMAIWR